MGKVEKRELSEKSTSNNTFSNAQMIDTREIRAKDESIKFPHLEIEKKWMEIWEKTGLYKTEIDSNKAKYYVLDMYPYPSGSGLHVGHVEGYTATDIVSRYKRMKGFEVLHPMGWDSFGLPTENFAIKTGMDPHDTTRENIDIFRRQCIRTGLSIDWTREIDTSQEDYYLWTQQLFLDLYEKGLAYKNEAPANWCTGCQTVISNEQVIDSKCERCDSPVETKKIEQWFFKITNYADRLIEDLDKVDWPENSKLIQKNWIGKTDGYEITVQVEGKNDKVKIFTTNLQKIETASFVVLAPEFPDLYNFVTTENTDEIENYIKNVTPQSETGRKKSDWKKSGVFTGTYIINPITKERMPVLVADYALMELGKGIFLGTPSINEKDRDFAIKFGLAMGKELKGKISKNKNEKILQQLGESVEKKTLYKLRDWLVSRERYWGAPIPIVHCEKCGDVPVPREQLPVTLPKMEDFKPTGVPPLARSKEFLNTRCPNCGDKAERETKTLDTFVDSAWYFLRFIDPKNNKELGNKKLLDKWLPVDYYMGGADHLTGHLMYSRFIVKVLFDIGKISIDEPFLSLKHIGMIFGEDGRKMSKRWGNSVNPEDVANAIGSDSLRLFEMFLGPIDQPKIWNTKSINGPRRFIDKVWQSRTKVTSNKISAEEIGKINPLITKVGSAIESNKFNTAVSDFMTYLNSIENSKTISRESFEIFLKLLSPFAPFITEELWQRLGNKNSIHTSSWPELIKQDIESGTEISIMINGRFKGTIIDQGWNGENINEQIINFLKDDENLAKEFTEGVEYKNIIYKKDRVINIIR